MLGYLVCAHPFLVATGGKEAYLSALTQELRTQAS